ncbi:hypothetical protein SAMN05421509_101257 [Chromohalobacter canadensis]|uniref:Uncharacterized protein n=1 Tax=Chromohalobacter canadensis TaxID=141389 RepID=A0A285VB53_9GAMM|nr:hypothetical protein SAMN05421509_101257 [Chromohalobacter canadensis]
MSRDSHCPHAMRQRDDPNHSFNIKGRHDRRMTQPRRDDDGASISIELDTLLNHRHEGTIGIRCRSIEMD